MAISLPPIANGLFKLLVAEKCDPDATILI